MEVQTLNQKKLKSTLSVKKSKTKEVIKNILCTPYKNTFWPELSSDDQLKLRKILEKNLPEVKTEKINVPWNEIKDVPKTERKKCRIEYSRRLNLQQTKNCNSQDLVLGVNDVTNSLERDCLSMVLLSNDVQPRLMVQHIIDLAILKKVPILVVADLRNLIKKNCGIRSVAMGIKNPAVANNLLNIVNCVQNIFKGISFPEEHINFNRSFVINTEQKQPEEKMDTTTVDTENKMCSDNNLTHSSIYLAIREKCGRVFIPEVRKKIEFNEILSKEESNELNIQFQGIKSKYKSVKVKRLKKDSSRRKKKINSLKKS